MPILSINDCGSPHGYAYGAGFRAFEFDTNAELADEIIRNAWSPCVWRDGRRRKEGFVRADLFVFDFDDGATLEDMKYWCEIRELAYVIGTTRSHQKEKVSKSGKVLPPCDRFRVVVPAETSCADATLFEQNMRRWIKTLKCDKSCVDAARFYHPCTAIFAMGNGHALPWTAAPPEEIRRRERAQAKFDRQLANNIVPRWVEDILRHGVPPGGRHTACCNLGAKLHAFGLSEPQIVELVMQSPLAEIGALDVQRAVGWGVRNAHRA